MYQGVPKMPSMMNETERDEFGKILSSYISEKTASALSMMLGTNVEHKLRSVVQKDLVELDDIVPPFVDTITMNGVHLNTQGDLNVGLLFYMPLDSAKKLASKLLGEQDLKDLTELGQSSINEVGNIMAGSFFNAISDKTGFQLDGGVPGYGINDYRSLLEQPAAEIASDSGDVVVSDVVLSGDDGTKIHVIILLNTENAKKLVANHNSMN